MNPSRTLLSIGLLIACVTVARARVEFLPLPAALSVQVTSTNPPPVPTLQRWLVSKRTISLTDDVTFSAFVTNCPACNGRVMFCQSSDLTQCNSYVTNTFDNSFTLQSGGDGWQNTSRIAPMFDVRWPRGVYAVSVILIGGGGNGLSNAYSPAQLDALFGAGAGSVTLTDWPELTPQPYVNVDYLSISPTTVTSETEPVTIAMHVTGGASYAYFYLTPSGVGYLGGIYLDGSVDVNGWFNVTALPLDHFSVDGWRQADTPYVPYVQLYVPRLQKTARLMPSQIRSALGGVSPTITLTGTDFIDNHIPPHCNFTLTPGPVSVTAQPGDVTLDAECDGQGAWVSRWYLAAPTGTFLYGQEQASESFGSSVTLPPGAAAGTYSVDAIFVTDRVGNVAVYSNHRPPFANSIWAAQAGEGWLYTDELNTVWGEAGGATSSGAHLHGGGVPFTLYTACVAFAWCLL